MKSDSVEFRIPVSWDIALEILKHAARHGRCIFVIDRYDNGYLRLRKRQSFIGATTLDIAIRAEALASTVVTIKDVGRRLARPRHRRQVWALMDSFRSDVQLFARILAKECCVGSSNVNAASLDQEPEEPTHEIDIQSPERLDGAIRDELSQLDQFLRTLRAIRVTVPNPEKPALEFGDAPIQEHGSPWAIVVDVIGSGGIELLPGGVLEFRDGACELVLSAPVRLAPDYAGQETEFRLALGSPVFGSEDRIYRGLWRQGDGVMAAIEEAERALRDTAARTAVAPFTIAMASVDPLPVADRIQLAVVTATVRNSGEAVGNAQLSLFVCRDGEEVERFPISQSLALPGGETGVTTRYIPLEGWSEGEWTFGLLLETIEGNGAAVVVASQTIEGSITVS